MHMLILQSDIEVKWNISVFVFEIHCYVYRLPSNIVSSSFLKFEEKKKVHVDKRKQTIKTIFNRKSGMPQLKLIEFLK